MIQPVRQGLCSNRIYIHVCMYTYVVSCLSECVYIHAYACNLSLRLKIVSILTNFFRSVIALSPDELLHAVYLCLNKVLFCKNIIIMLNELHRR